MRLTNVAQMSLPPGRLRSFVTPAGGEPGRALPVSFDQGRHVGAGERPGSWMAVAFRLPLGTTEQALGDAWMRVIARHGALRTAFSRGEAGGVQLHEVEVRPGAWADHEVPEGMLARDVLRTVLDDACTPFGRPSHRLCVLHPEIHAGSDADDPRPVAIVGSDHAHVDMWSLLILVRDLTETLAGSEPRPDVTDFAEHSVALERMPPAPAEVHERWDAILAAGDGVMPRFPLPLGDVSTTRPEVVVVRDVLGSLEAARFDEVAACDGVRPTALALAVLTRVTLAHSGGPLRAVFPVHSRHEPRWHDAVGWFITNSVIECAEATPAACAASVKNALALGSHPLAPILRPYGGMPEAPGMFAISWLDTRRLPAVGGETQIQYVSAAIRTDGVMIWFIVNDAGLHLRCRYPDTPEARTNVGRWLDAVEQGLRDAAASAPSHTRDAIAVGR